MLTLAEHRIHAALSLMLISFYLLQKKRYNVHRYLCPFFEAKTEVCFLCPMRSQAAHTAGAALSSWAFIFSVKIFLVLLSNIKSIEKLLGCYLFFCIFCMRNFYPWQTKSQLG